jgi:hypothetical protein
MRRTIDFWYFNNADPQVNAPLRRDVFAEFDVPVGKVDEVLPTVVAVQGEIDLHKRAPFGALGLAYEMHAGFVGGPVGFVSVAANTRADDVFPSGGAAPVTRDNVVEIQIFPVEHVTAVLTGILIAFKDVMPGKFNLFFRHPVVHEEQNNPRDADTERDAVDGVVVRGVCGNIAPFGKIQGAERAVRIIQNDLGVTLKEESESATGGADIDCLPEPI